MLKQIVSFGYKYLPQAEPFADNHVVVDIRRMFYNPYANPTLRSLTGLDARVQEYVMRTRNFQAVYEHLKAMVHVPGVEVAYIGCQGGKHRSVFLAQKLGQDLGVPVVHQDLDKTEA